MRGFRPAIVLALVLFPAAGSARTPSAGETAWEDLAQGNRRFATGHPRPAAAADAHVADWQSSPPVAAVLDCADNPATADRIFDEPAGALFQVRTLGTLTDATALSALEYAVVTLHVPLLVVLGHVGCEAVREADAGAGEHGSAGLDWVAGRIRPELADVSERPGEARSRAAVTASVARGATDLIAASPLLREALAAGELSVVRAVFDPETGGVTRLP